jgi:uncharacterized membrane protein HdeD (DUF308 family)
MTEIPTRRSQPAASPAAGYESPVVREPGSLFPWWTVLVVGLVSILFGLAVLVWPDVTLRVMAVLVGLWLLLIGVTRIFGAFLPGPGLGRQVLSGVIGFIILIGGLLCLRNLVNALAVLAFMVALTWLFTGLAETIMAFQATGVTRMVFLVVGLLSLAAGFVFLFWPGLSLAALVLMTGISALILGIGELALAFRLRREMS